MLGLAEKSLMHVFDLVLEVGQCVDITGLMASVANLLLGRQMQIVLGDGIDCGWQGAWVDR